MSKVVDIVVVAAQAKDAELLLEELRSFGHAPRMRHVAGESALIFELGRHPDVVIADSGTSGLDAARVIEMTSEHAPDAPVIVVSDDARAERIVELMQRGASDFVLQGELARLGPAVARAQSEGRRRREVRAADESLRATEERQRLALDGGQMGLWEWNIYTGSSVWNAREYDLLGLSVGSGEETGEFFFRQIHPDDRERVRREVEDCLAAGTDLDTQMRVVRPDGQVRWLAAKGRIKRGPNGRLTHMIGVNFDVTDRKLDEQRLRDSENRLRTMLNSEPECVKLIDAQCRLLEMNPAGLAMIEVDSAEQVLGRCVLDIVVPEHRDAVRAAMEQAFAGQTAAVTFEIVGMKGTRRWMESYVSPLRDGDGRVAAALAVTRDITARIQAEAAVRASQQMLETVMNNIPQGVFWKDRDSVYLGSNRVSLKAGGFERPEELIGKRDCDLPGLLPEEAAFYVEKDREVMATGKPQLGIVETMTLPDGSQIWLETSKLPLLDADGNVVGVLGTWQDITERRKLQEQLLQAQKMDAIGQLAGGVAHDFNNLLTIILGYSELALAALPPDSSDARDHVAAIRDAGERASALTRHLLAFSRQQMLEPQVLDLNDVVAGSEKMLRRLIGEDIALATLLAPSLPKVRVDPGQIEQVILNLVVNARDAMPAGGRLILETRLDEAHSGASPSHCPGASQTAPRCARHVRLTVRDTGCGIPADIKPRVFEPFFTTKAPGRGTGLGLSTVYGIVKQSGGWIDVASEQGVGTTFDLYFPAVEGQREPQATQKPAANPCGLETILLVEDDAAVRVLARQALERQGYRILEAAGGRAAIRIAQTCPQPIDLLITDVVMPDLGGRELAEILVAQRPQLKVLFVSGYTEDALLRRGIAQATTAYLPKPFTLPALARRTREMLDQAT